MDLHGMSIEQIGKLKDDCHKYLAMWFGFDRTAKAKRTTEWIEAASKRLEGQVEPCCECGNPFPRADLLLRDHIYCHECRKLAEAKKGDQ